MHVNYFTLHYFNCNLLIKRGWNCRRVFMDIFVDICLLMNRPIKVTEIMCQIKRWNVILSEIFRTVLLVYNIMDGALSWFSCLERFFATMKRNKSNETVYLRKRDEGCRSYWL